MSMKNKILTAFTLVTISTTAFADNRAAGDDIFSEPKKAGWTQMFLGFSELLAAQYAYPGLSSQARGVAIAELELAVANDLPVSEAQRRSTISAILQNPESYDFESNVGDESSLNTRAAQRVEKLRSVSIASATQKSAAIRVASFRVGSAREAALKAAQELGLVDKTVRVVRQGAAVILVGDIIARIYVWNAMEANPTLSPAATYIYNQLAD